MVILRARTGYTLATSLAKVLVYRILLANLCVKSIPNNNKIFTFVYYGRHIWFIAIIIFFQLISESIYVY